MVRSLLCTAVQGGVDCGRRHRVTTKKTSVSAKDVALAAGVSRAAVSRTFTPGASVSPETRSKVLAAAEQLGYHVNHLARGLMRDHTGIVALIAAEIATPYRSALVSALTERLQAAGRVAMIINSDRSDDSVAAALRQAISYRTDAAVVLSGLPDRSLAETCHRNGMGLVLINRDEDRPGSVQIRLNDAEAALHALHTLLRAGCRRIALASSEAGTPSLLARETGFLKAAREEGVDVICERIGATSYETGLRLGEALFVRPDRPDGVFCTTDLMAFGLMDAARHRFRLRVPEELSVIGFDDIAQSGWDAYQLTTFAQPVDGIAEAAIDWLERRERDRAVHAGTEIIHLSASMIWRHSVRPRPADGED